MRHDRLQEDVLDFYKKPPTNNICEANNRSTSRFIEYVHLPVVLAVRKCFQWASLETRQVRHVGSGLLHVPQRVGTRLAASFSVGGGAFKPLSRRAVTGQEYEQGRRAPVDSTELMEGMASQPQKKAKASIASAGQASQQQQSQRPSGSSRVSRQTSHLTRRTTYVTLSFLDAVDADAALLDLLDNIRAEGLPTGSIVQCKNTKPKEKWCVFRLHTLEFNLTQLQVHADSRRRDL